MGVDRRGDVLERRAEFDREAEFAISSEASGPTIEGAEDAAVFVGGDDFYESRPNRRSSVRGRWLRTGTGRSPFRSQLLRQFWIRSFRRYEPGVGEDDRGDRLVVEGRGLAGDHLAATFPFRAAFVRASVHRRRRRRRRCGRRSCVRASRSR